MVFPLGAHSNRLQRTPSILLSENVTETRRVYREQTSLANFRKNPSLFVCKSCAQTAGSRSVEMTNQNKKGNKICRFDLYDDGRMLCDGGRKTVRQKKRYNDTGIIM